MVGIGKNQNRNRDFENRGLEYLDSLYFMALRLTNSRQDAEDLVQETYRKAFDHSNQLRDMEKCRPWLYAIMVNTWKNLRTKGSRETSLEDWEQGLDSDSNPDSHQPDPENELMNQEVRSVVESGLKRLASHYRMAVVLSDIEGFTYKEISEITGWPIGTVMSRLSRARHLLAGYLIKYKGKI